MDLGKVPRSGQAILTVADLVWTGALSNYGRPRLRQIKKGIARVAVSWIAVQWMFRVAVVGMGFITWGGYLLARLRFGEIGAALGMGSLLIVLAAGGTYWLHKREFR